MIDDNNNNDNNDIKRIIRITAIIIMHSIFRKTGHVCSMSRKCILFDYTYRWLLL